jgi:transcriptional regulator with XRE-family HTH domain
MFLGHSPFPFVASGTGGGRSPPPPVPPNRTGRIRNVVRWNRPYRPDCRCRSVTGIHSLYSRVFRSTYGVPVVSDVGASLRRAREEAGLSLAALATRTHFSRGHLANVESGRRKPTPDVVLAYERALGDDVHRRTLLTGLATAVVAPMVMSEALHGAFTEALADPIPVEQWQDRAEHYGRDYMTLGAGTLSTMLVADLVRLQQFVKEPKIWAPAARLMTVYGKTLPTNEGTKGALHWYRLASAVADRSGDTPTRVWVRGRAALALAYEAAELPTALALSDQAIGLSDRPSLGQLNALVARAHVAGAVGDHATAATAMEESLKVFDLVGSTEQISDFAVPEWRFHTFASMLWSRLGDESRAMAAQDAADRTRPTTLPRFATHIELHRGLMLAKSGDKPGGLAYAQAALDRLPPERHSLSLRLLTDEITRSR